MTKFEIARSAIKQARQWGWTGRISDGRFGPGKFEGEPFYAPYFYSIAHEGGGDEPFYDGEDIAGEPVPVSDDERDVFALHLSTDFMIVWYSPNGFVSVLECTAAAYDRLRERYDGQEVA